MGWADSPMDQLDFLSECNIIWFDKEANHTLKFVE